MDEQRGYTNSISTAQFTDTPRVSLEQPTGDVYVEAWDRPEVEVSCSDPDAMFELQQQGNDIIISNRPGSYKSVNFVEPGQHQPGPRINIPAEALNEVK